MANGPDDIRSVFTKRYGGCMNLEFERQKSSSAKFRKSVRGAAPYAVLLLAAITLTNPAAAQPTTFTTPIDITGFKTQLHAVAPDPNTGHLVDVAIPVGVLGPKMSAFLATPMSDQFDRYWNVTTDPKSGKTARDTACSGTDANGTGGIVKQVQDAVAKIGSGFSAQDISCDLASTGKLLLQQNGSLLTLGYLLTNNTVSFRATTPFTCNHGTIFCPHDPRFKVTFATELVTTVDAPSLCGFKAGIGTVVIQAVNIEGDSLTGDLAVFADSLFLGHKFPAAERGIESAQHTVPLPLDAAFQEMSGGPACVGNSPIRRILFSFRDFDTEVKPPQGIVFTMTHPPLLPPVVNVPDPSATAPPTPPQPTFTRPMIATDRPSVGAGNPVEVNGRFFPLNPNFTTALPVTFGHPGFGGNSVVLGGPCFGGGTDLRFGPAGGVQSQQRLLGTGQSTCPGSFGANNLTPATAFQFSARDCDAITCSPFSVPVRVTTAKVDPNRGRLTLKLDGAANLGSTTLSAAGTFDTNVSIPAGTTPGTHKLIATSGPAAATVDLVITAPNAKGKASVMMVGILKGETGCPNHPISSTVTDATFTLFGAGFQPGALTVRLDTLNGFSVGSAIGKADGSFCQTMPGVPGKLAGVHKFVAIQNGAIQSQTAVTFVLPTIFH
jgi:hypothetical protein